MPSAISKHGDHQIRCTIDHLRVIRKFWYRRYKTCEPQDSLNPFETSKRRLGLRQNIERTQLSRLLSIIYAKRSPGKVRDLTETSRYDPAIATL